MTEPGNFRDRLEWDQAHGEIRDGDIRYMMIRPDALMGMFKNLPEQYQILAFQALQDSIVEHGGRSARAYQEMGADDAVRLLAVIEETAPQLGWGLWRFSGVGPVSLVLEVRNSPFAAGYGTARRPVCAPIAGMLQAVSALALGDATEVVETDCAALSAELCRFTARRVAER